MKENLGLNKEQLKAVTAPLGPVLILAGAGSGKTRALTMRIVYLIKKLGLKPENILAVTFTNKAAGEMKERVKKLLKFPISNFQFPMMGTFHSIGAKILRSEGRLLGLESNFVIYDSDDSESLVKEILIQQRVDPTKFKPSLFSYIIDRAKNNLQDPKELEELGDKKFQRLVQTVYTEYQLHLNKNNAADFGDLIMLPVKLFQTYPEVLKKYQDKWQYILVDEYQDTNHAQYVLTKLLAASHKNIFVVGDDAQAIYGFRGADLQNILDFEDDYPETKIIRLEQNYRSTAPILSVAEKVIAQSTGQHKKKLWTENEQGQTPMLYRAEDEMAEAWFVGKTIIEIQDGVSNELIYEDEEDESILSRIQRQARTRILPKLIKREGLNNIAVLYRTHAQSRAIEEMLISAGIPYQIVGGLKFYERKEIKDVLAYLRLLVNPVDIVSLKRVINVPPRGIGPKAFDLLKEILLNRNSNIEYRNSKQIQISNVQNLKRFEFNNLNLDIVSDFGFRASDLNSRISKVKPQIQNFFDTIDTIANLPDDANMLDVLRNVMKLTGYEVYLRDGTEEGEGRLENIQELFNVAVSFQKFPWREGLNRFLEEVALMTSMDELNLDSPKVTLMTLHQAKGLEFDTVFLIGLEEGLLPHAKSILEAKDVAEEIRLAYVGVTRAKKRLYLVHALSRKQYGQRNISVPSRILTGIPEDLLEIYEQEY